MIEISHCPMCGTLKPSLSPLCDDCLAQHLHDVFWDGLNAHCDVTEEPKAQTERYEHNVAAELAMAVLAGAAMLFAVSRLEGVFKC